MLTREQLLDRKSGIGGSDVAAVLELSPWRTPFEVYMDKTSDHVSDPVMDGPLYIGSMLEPFVRSEYERRTRQRVIVPDKAIRHPKYPWLLASVDGLVEGADCGWEGKVIGNADPDEWGEEGTDQVPVYYLLQCQHYMLVTGLSSWDLTALIGNREVRTYTLTASKPLHDAIIEKTRDFWVNHVEARVPPAFAGAREARMLFARAEPKPIETDDEQLVALNAIIELRKHRKALDAEEDRLLGSVMAYMQEHDTLTLGGKPIATWKERVANRVDTSRLRDKYPDAAADCTVKSSSRVFLVKEPKETSND